MYLLLVRPTGRAFASTPIFSHLPSSARTSVSSSSVRRSGRWGHLDLYMLGSRRLVSTKPTAREREQTQLSTQSKPNVSWGSSRVVPIVLATILMSAVPLSGVLAVFSFAGDILEQIFPTYRNLASILIPVAGSVGVLCVTQGADRLGRKPVSGASLYFDHVGKALCA